MADAPGRAPTHIHTTLRWGRAPGKPSLAGAFWAQTEDFPSKKWKENGLTAKNKHAAGFHSQSLKKQSPQSVSWVPLGVRLTLRVVPPASARLHFWKWELLAPVPRDVRLTPETKRNSRRRAWRRTSPTSAECLSRSIMETVSSLTCDPEMPSYLGDPSPRGGPLVGASHLSRASLWASREQEQTVSRVHRPCHHSPQQQHQGIRAAESQRCGEAVIVKLLLKYGANYVQSSRVNPPLFPPVRTIQTISQDCGHGPGPPWLRRWMAGPQRDGGKVTRTLPSGSGPRWQAGGDQSAGAHKPVPTEGLASSGRDMQASRTWQEWTAVPINTCVCAPTVCR